VTVQFGPLKTWLFAAGGGVMLAAASLPLHAQETEPAARAAELRAQIPDLPHLVRTTPHIYLIRIEKIETAAPEPGASAASQPSEVTAVVEKTLKGRREKKLVLKVQMRPPGAVEAGLVDAGPDGDPEAIHKSPMFYSPEHVLSPRNPAFGGPAFEMGKRYVVFTDMAAETLLGGPYGYQEVSSDRAFWVTTVKRLVANPDSKHAIKMSFQDFVRLHRSAFLMAVADCLGTEVTLSEPLWGEPVSRKDIDPQFVLPESARDCAGIMDEQRGYLGLIEAKPWVYQVRRGYPNQSYVEIRDGMLDFSGLGLDIEFPGNGRISVTDLAERMSGGSAH
jgi:hypothetical protein